jgi:parallel beta-helix repeat protein
VQHRHVTPVLALGLVLCFFATLAVAKVIRVPGDQPTIQAGIGVASNGDTVLVAPGMYFENINFDGKDIIVNSLGGAKTTIIDGSNTASVVTFGSGEGRHAVLRGFTLQNGMATAGGGEGGGVYIVNSSPTVVGNIIKNNSAPTGGGGIAVTFSSAMILGNLITLNTQSSGFIGGSGGGGVEVGGAGSAVIAANVIVNNSWTTAEGGGMTLFAAGIPTIVNNVIAGNTAFDQGGGIWIVNDSEAVITQNLIFKNTAGDLGGGIYFLVGQGHPGPSLVNNTIAQNNAPGGGSAVFAGGFDSGVPFFNNLLIGDSGQSAVFCDSTYTSAPPTFTTNDAFSPGGGGGLVGTCASQSTLNGNISADPLFVDVTHNNYQLQAGSPAIDVGTNSAPHLPKKDLAGKPRIADGDDDGDLIVDMGVYEVQ